MADPCHIPICVLPHAAGWHVASWRRPWAVDKEIWNPDVWKRLAQTAERGRLDAIFLADLVALWPAPEHLRHHTAHVGQWEAFTLLSALAMVTEHIGLIATGHTEYGSPYNMARRTACLDHLSRGRAGWNVVTSSGPEQARNFGKGDQDPTELRYARATEFVDVVRGLWDSWEDDAYIRERSAGIFYDPEKLHVLDHKGEHYTVRGPLNVMRPPQGHPVLAQAGSSGPGKKLAASIGELIFTPHSGYGAQAYRREIRAIARELGRDPDGIKVLSQVTPVVARTQGEADAKWDELQSLRHPEIARGVVEAMLGVDLSAAPLDEPLPETVQGIMRVTGYHDAVMDYIRSEKPTVRQLIHNYKGPGTIVGPPEVIADYIEAEVESGACDGFVLLIQGMPEELEDFVELVIPELQKRGRFRTEYTGTTLRENLGLARPPNRFAGTSGTEGVAFAAAWNALR